MFVKHRESVRQLICIARGERSNWKGTFEEQCEQKEPFEVRIVGYRNGGTRHYSRLLLTGRNASLRNPDSQIKP